MTKRNKNICKNSKNKIKRKIWKQTENKKR